jgi:DNA-binding NtrC family response regulator
MKHEKLPKVLVIDDDKHVLEQMPDILDGMCEVESAISIDEGLNKLKSGFFDVILLDLHFNGDQRTGLDAFELIQMIDRTVDVIVISGETNVERIVSVFHYGISRFVAKPASVATIRNEVAMVLEKRKIKLQVLDFERGNKGCKFNPLMGESPAIRTFRDQTATLITAGVNDICLQGGTGSGKEEVANFIAYKMDSSRKIFPLHCGAISDGLVESELFGHMKGAFTGADKDKIGIFEAASGGFVFLDEIGEMPLLQQAKLLRVLEQRAVRRIGSNHETPVNFKFNCATHVNLKEAVEQKRFREDLYYRITRNVLFLPTLKDRIEDLPLILNSFKLKKNENPVEFTKDAIDLMKEYPWAGNFRELKDTAERIVNNSDSPVIRQADIFRAVPEFSNKTQVLRGLVGQYGVTIISAEKKRFIMALEQSRGNRGEAAKILGLSRATYYRRAKELGIGRWPAVYHDLMK